MADPQQQQQPPPATPAPTKPAFSLTGVVGTPFTIEGSGFGKETGTVLIGGHAVPLTSWRDDRIKGTIPSRLERGEAVITVKKADEQDAAGTSIKAKI